MSGLSRFTQKLFGKNSPNIAIFGSQASGTGQIASDVGNAQSLDAYTNGWAAASIGGQYRPTLEDFDALHYIDSYQINYILQQGIPEYDAGTTYCLTPSPSIVKAPGTAQLYVSLIDNNIGNALTDTGAWSVSLNLGGSSAGTLTGDMTDAPQLTYSSSTVVNVSTGRCSDSTRSTMINNTSIQEINLLTSGAGGLDTGSLPSGNSTLHYFIINGSSGCAGLASLSPTAPTLPNGYNTFRRIGSLYFTVATNIPNFIQTGNKFIKNTQDQEFNGTTLNGSVSMNIPSGVVIQPIIFINLIVSGGGQINATCSISASTNINTNPNKVIINNNYVSDGADNLDDCIMLDYLSTSDGNMIFNMVDTTPNGRTNTVTIYSQGWTDSRIN